MPVLLIVLLLGTGVNAVKDGAHDLPTFKASIVKQVTHPVIVADYKKLNQ